MQQQFERMDVLFNEMRDQMDRQDAVIATWHEGHPQRVPNVRRQERRAPVDDSDADHEDEFNRHAFETQQTILEYLSKKTKIRIFDRTPQPIVYK